MKLDLKLDEVDFWQAAFLSSIADGFARHGLSPEFAARLADNAVLALRERLKWMEKE